MSALLPAGASAASEPVSEADVVRFFHEAAKPRERHRVGAEFERFAVERETGRHLTYDEPGGIKSLLEGLASRFGWRPHVNEAGYLTALERDGASVSLEPGGQVEFATPPVESVDEVAAHLGRHKAELRAVVDPSRVAFLAAGVAPLAAVEDIPLMPRVRHRVMAEYLPKRSATALLMMKATASTQVAFDYADEADAARKFTVAVKLGPVINALWGNAPLLAGRQTGFASYRGRVWEGMDPDRSGLLPELLSARFTFARWADYVLDSPLMFTCVGGRYRPAASRTFRDFLRHGENDYFPTMADWEVQLTTVFPEARLKRFLEVRGADAVPGDLALSVPALWKGLLYDEESLAGADALAGFFRPADLPALFATAYRDGLAGVWGGRRLGDWCREVLTLASEGLRRQAARLGHADERRFLDPAWAVLERGRSPGADFRHRNPQPPGPAGVLAWFEDGGVRSDDS